MNNHYTVTDYQDQMHANNGTTYICTTRVESQEIDVGLLRILQDL